MARKYKTYSVKKKGPSALWKRLTNRRFLAFAGGFILLMLVYFLYDMPGTDEVRPLEASPAISILAADGTVIARYGGLKGNIVSVAELPKPVIDAVLAIEDRRFYDHFGLDPIGVIRAMTANMIAGQWVQGASTITQQLAKNLFLTPDKTLRRKLQEALLALQIEYKFEKDDILSAYLNRVYFGSGAYGIDAAARVYFNKNARNLTLWEGAVLAGLLKAPSRFSPAADADRARDRAKVVIRAMQDAGYITEKQMEKELARKVVGGTAGDSGDMNRYFGDWIINQIDSFVSNNDRELKVYTTFNPALQKTAVAKQEAIFSQIKPEEKISQVALVTLAKDGAVLAMIGGKKYSESQFNRAAQALRQPGSVFKPFVFLAALEAGYTPDNFVEDAPIKTGSYRPDNYENKYYGEVSLTQALAYSLNTATIRVLQTVGMARLLDVAQRLGLTQKFKAELATGLGAGESNLLELTNAYAVIANGGHAVWPYAVLKIEDVRGNVLYQHEAVGHTQLFATRDIDGLDSMLVQVVAQGTGQAAQLGRGHVAGKTGTTQNYRDAWFIGYTDRLVTGVWMGNDDNTSMVRVSGGRYPARLWREYMQDAIGIAQPKLRGEFIGGRAPEGSEGGGFSSMISRWSSGWDSNSGSSSSNKPQDAGYNR